MFGQQQGTPSVSGFGNGGTGGGNGIGQGFISGNNNNSNGSNNTGSFFGSPSPNTGASPFGTSSTLQTNSEDPSIRKSPFGMSKNVNVSMGAGMPSTTNISVGMASDPRASAFGSFTNVVTTNTNFGHSSNVMAEPVPEFSSPAGNSFHSGFGMGTNAHTKNTSSDTSMSTGNNNTPFGGSSMKTDYTNNAFGGFNDTAGASPFGTSAPATTTFGSSPFVQSSASTGTAFRQNTSSMNAFAPSTSAFDKSSNMNTNMTQIDHNLTWQRSSEVSSTEGQSKKKEAQAAEVQKKHAALMEKIEEKKKKLLRLVKEQQHHQTEQMNVKGGQQQPNPKADGLNLSAPVFTPAKADTDTSNDYASDHADRSKADSSFRSTRIPRKKEKNNNNGEDGWNGALTSPVAQEAGGKSNKKMSTLAEKNSVRFAHDQNRSSTSFLPAELQQRARDYHPSQASTTDNGSNDNGIEDATIVPDLGGKSLVGACTHMCPDEELIRRESESDVQMLEYPHPDIHPKGWTLRNTAVKRFRRSAADFKLDIPELVRPPHVLESVCGYLEEWVMERDRQGTDPRFGQSPLPLDVYQFIWDRTRMIRKDFTLQNFVGTGGRCNAIAVRCHERIARWHALCEHQLSHLEDFARMQSQQNIQELGQTMKTLNQYYDDSEGRSTLLDGEEENKGVVHGCRSTSVMGKSPCDYGGLQLMNDAAAVDVSNRIIGNPASGSGTAEPEMRGLYIILTINNDNGMEVLKYAARLSRDRPDVFNSKPVQLAMKVYKATREYNYAKFFSLLQSSSTPYLYSCIMFKLYVGTMRKAAFRIMAKTFGTKSKERGSVYDQYLLRDLVHLLCFENLEEARKACKHYNITVVEVPISEGSSTVVECIRWRDKEFREPRDSSKGHKIPLKSWKMNRVIESKLGGVTRLAVCRGEVSGVGASCNEPEYEKHMEELRIQKQAKLDKQMKLSEEARRVEKEKKEKLRQRMLLLKKEKERVAREESRRKEEELQQIEMRRRENEAKKAKEAALKVAEARKRAQEEANRLAREKEVEAERKRLEQLEKEKERLAAEEKEQQRQAELKKVQQENARKERIRMEAEEKLKREQEAEQIRILNIKREEEERLERQRKAEEIEKRRIEMEWQAKINFARKLVAMKKWSKSLSTVSDRRSGAKISMEHLHPLKSLKLGLRPNVLENYNRKKVVTVVKRAKVSYEEIFYQLGTDMSTSIDLSEILFRTLSEMGVSRSLERLRSTSRSKRNLVLFKLGVVFKGDRMQDELPKVIKMWVDSRLQLGRFCCSSRGDFEVRTVATSYESGDVARRSCDAILVIIPPTLKVMNQTFHVQNIPNAVLRLNGGNFDQKLLEGCTDVVYQISSIAVNRDKFLLSKHLFMIEKHDLRQLCSSTLRRSLYSFSSNESTFREPILCPPVQRTYVATSAQRLIGHCQKFLSYLIEQVSKSPVVNTRSWPAPEFVVDGQVPSYFSEISGLTAKWKETIDATRLQEAVWHAFPSMRRNDPSLMEFLHDILNGAPIDLQQRCGAFYQDDKLCDCVDYALLWYERECESRLLVENSTDDYVVYLPLGSSSTLLHEYLRNTTKPNVIVVEKTEVPLLLMDQEDRGPGIFVNYQQKQKQQRKDGGGGERQDGASITTVDLPLSSPRNSNKRHIFQGSPLDYKRLRVDVATMDGDKSSNGISECTDRNSRTSNDLQRSKNFTLNLETLRNEGIMAMDAVIMGDPHLRAMVESDESLKALMKM